MFKTKKTQIQPLRIDVSANTVMTNLIRTESQNTGETLHCYCLLFCFSLQSKLVTKKQMSLSFQSRAWRFIVSQLWENMLSITERLYVCFFSDSFDNGEYGKMTFWLVIKLKFKKKTASIQIRHDMTDMSIPHILGDPSATNTSLKTVLPSSFSEMFFGRTLDGK